MENKEEDFYSQQKQFLVEKRRQIKIAQLRRKIETLEESVEGYETFIGNITVKIGKMYNQCRLDLKRAKQELSKLEEEQN